MRIKARGSALIAALLIMALITMLVTAMSIRVRIDIDQTKRSLEYEHMILSASEVTFWAMHILQDPKHIWISKHNNGIIASFPKKLQNQGQGIMITGEIYDLQANFNLNNLLDNNFQIIFYNLIKNVLKDRAHAENLLKNTTNMIRPSTNFETSTINHGPMQDVSEFRVIKGVNAKFYLQLAKYLTALPAITPINLNTASLQILSALGQGISDKEAGEIINARGIVGIQNLMNIRDLLMRLRIPIEQVDIQSNYFLLVTKSTGPNITRKNYTILNRHTSHYGKHSVRVLSTSM